MRHLSKVMELQQCLYHKQLYYHAICMRKILECCCCPRSLVMKLTSPNFEDLKIAIWKQEIEKIPLLLEKGAPTHDKGETILHFAVSIQKFEAIEFIGNNYYGLLDERNEDGDTPLTLALFSGNEKIIEHLLNISNPNIKDNFGNTPFIIAAANGNLETLQLLLKNPSINPMTQNIEGQNALHRACYYGQIEVIQCLLKNTKIKFCHTDKKNNNCLHMACLGCQIICVRYVISKVKHPEKLLESRNKDGKRPLQVLEDMINKLNIQKKNAKRLFNFGDIYNYVLKECSAQYTYQMQPIENP